MISDLERVIATLLAEIIALTVYFTKKNYRIMTTSLVALDLV